MGAAESMLPYRVLRGLRKWGRELGGGRRQAQTQVHDSLYAPMNKGLGKAWLWALLGGPKAKKPGPWVGPHLQGLQKYPHPAGSLSLSLHISSVNNTRLVHPVQNRSGRKG